MTGEIDRQIVGWQYRPIFIRRDVCRRLNDPALGWLIGQWARLMILNAGCD